MNSKQKGNRGERELAKVLREYGYDCRRGQQYSGANGDADVVGLPMIHIECKRVEKLNIYSAMAQSIHDKRDGEYPAVFHRRNNCEWLVTMRLEDFIEIYREFESGVYLDDAISKDNRILKEEQNDNTDGGVPTFKDHKTGNENK